MGNIRAATRYRDNVIWFELGRNLKEARLRKGMTRRELADKAQTGLSFIAKLEAGERRLHADWIPRFAKALEISEEEITKGISLAQLRRQLHLERKDAAVRPWPWPTPAHNADGAARDGPSEGVSEVASTPDTVTFAHGNMRIFVDFAARRVDIAEIVKTFHTTA